MSEQWYAVAVYDLNGKLDGIYNESLSFNEAKESAIEEANSSEYPYARAEVISGDGNEWNTEKSLFTAHRK